MSINNNPPSFLKEGVHVQMLIDRGVGNTNKGSRRWVNKLISTSVEEYDSNVDLLMDEQKYFGDENVRLYASMNPRSILSAIRMLHEKQSDHLFRDEESVKSFYIDIKNQFISCLMKQENSLRKYYLIDVDFKEKDAIGAIEHLLAVQKPPVNIVHIYETPNGYHYIATPFDVRIISDCYQEDAPIEVKKDGLILINTLGNE